MRITNITSEGQDMSEIQATPVTDEQVEAAEQDGLPWVRSLAARIRQEQAKNDAIHYVKTVEELQALPGDGWAAMAVDLVQGMIAGLDERDALRAEVERLRRGLSVIQVGDGIEGEDLRTYAAGVLSGFLPLQPPAQAEVQS